MALKQVFVATALGLRLYLRNPFFIVLLIIMPPSFITLSFVATPDVPFILSVPESGVTRAELLGMPTLHGAIMVPMTGAFLAGMVGLFVMLGSREADLRLVVAGYPAALLLVVRLSIIALLALVITVVSVAVTAIDFVPEQMVAFFLLNYVAALQYALLGAVTGTFLSAVSGTYIMFFAPMIDYGIVQNPMFIRESVPWWAHTLPGFEATEVLIDVSFTSAFDSASAALSAGLYLLAIAVLAAWLFLRQMNVRRRLV